ncbi:MAG: hypothetical protein ACYDAG_12025 [Chloroflexota bacterium]
MGLGRAYVESPERPAEQATEWLVRNYGARCTLVCAASVLLKLGASREGLMAALEHGSGFREGYGPPIAAYLGGHSRLDRAIERAGRAGGIGVRSRTRFLFGWRSLAGAADRGEPVVLNCFRAPGGLWSHSVLAVDWRAGPRRLLTLDPNDGEDHWLTWGRPATGWICTATFITRAPRVGITRAPRVG